MAGSAIAQNAPPRLAVYQERAGGSKTINLYLADLVSGMSVQVNPPLGARSTWGGVNYARFLPDGSKVYYVADQDTVGQLELYLADPQTQGQPVKLNAPLAAGTSVQLAYHTGDGRAIVYQVADANGWLGVYLVDLTGAQPGAAVRISSSIGTTGRGFGFGLPSLDGSAFYYVAEQSRAGNQEVYSVDISNPAQPGAPVRVDAGGVTGGVQLSPSGRYFLYQAGGGIMVVDTARPGSAVQVNASSGTGSGTTVGWTLSEDETQVLYAVGSDLYLVQLAQPGVAVRLNAPLAAGTQLGPWWGFAANGRRVVYAGQSSPSSPPAIYAVDVQTAGAPGTPVELASSQGVALAGQTSFIDFSQDGDLIAFRADPNGDGRSELYVSDVKTPAGTIAIGQVPAQLWDNQGFRLSFDNQTFAYMAAASSSDPYQVYLVDLAQPGTSVPVTSFSSTGDQLYQWGTLRFSADSQTLTFQTQAGSQSLLYQADVRTPSQATRLSTLQSYASWMLDDGTNAPPIARADAATTDAGTAVSISAFQNDNDYKLGGALAIASVTQPANGTVAVGTAGQITYTPNAGFTGQDTFTYTASDAQGLTDPAEVMVTVRALAPPPPPAPVVGYVLSDNAGYSNDLRTFSSADTLYVRAVTAMNVSSMRKATAELRDANGNKTKVNLANHQDGTFTASFGLSGYAPQTLTVKIKIENSQRVKEQYQTSISVLSIPAPPVAPTAAFSAGQTTGIAPHAVSFFDQSTGDVTSWAWDFGDGGASTQQNPAHTYQAAGSYSVTLTVGGPAGSDSLTRANWIVVSPPPAAPIASFSVNPQSGVAPVTVSFAGTIAGGPVTSWAWDFGDGGSSGQQNPTHTYQAAGTYSVALTVTGPGGSDTAVQPAAVTVTAPPVPAPTAGFSAAVSGMTVAFSDGSTGSVTAWSWSFGDGTTSAQANPSHTYQAAGSYTVQLTVSGPGGTSAAATQTVTVSQPQPVGDQISISKAELKVQKRKLTVKATSDQISQQPTLVLTYQAGGATHSVTMTFKQSKGRYEAKIQNVSLDGPAVTVTSSLGGTQTVNVVYK